MENKAHSYEEMSKTLDKHTEQFEILKKTFDMDFILYLDIVSKPDGSEFIDKLISFLRN